jgi:hypothetical protein
MGRKVPVFHANEDGWSDWNIPPNGKFRMFCCDCALAHDIEFKIIEGKIAFRMKRNTRATGAMRRHHGITVEH